MPKKEKQGVVVSNKMDKTAVIGNTKMKQEMNIKRNKILLSAGALLLPLLVFFILGRQEKEISYNVIKALAVSAYYLIHYSGEWFGAIQVLITLVAVIAGIVIAEKQRQSGWSTIRCRRTAATRLWNLSDSMINRRSWYQIP